MSAEFAPQTATVDMAVSTTAPTAEEQQISVEKPEAGTTESAPVETQEKPTEEGAAPTEEKKEESGAEKRIKQLVAQKHEMEQRIAVMEGILQQSQNQAISTQTEAPKAPNLDDFPNYADFETAQGEYIVNRSKFETAQMISQAAAQNRAQQLDSLFQARLAAASVEDPSIMTAVNDPTLPINPFVGSLIKESNLGPKIVKYLSDNRAVAMQFMAMQPIVAAREFGKLEYQLSVAPTPVKPEVKTVSAAPEPLKTTAGPTGRVTIRDEDLPIEEFVKRRNAKQYKLKG